MISINSRGDYTHGITGGLCINNVLIIGPGASYGYINDDVIGYVDGSQGWLTRRYFDGATLPTTPWSTASNKGYSGGGVMAWESPDPTRYGLVSTTGFVNAAATPLAAGPDGSIAWKLRDSFGPCWMRWLDGSDTKFTDGDATDVQMIGNGDVMWLEGGALRTTLPTPKTYPGPVWFPHAVRYRYEWWICYGSPALGLVAHPFTDYTRGFRFVPAGQDAWPAFRVLADDSLCCVWSNKIEQHAGQMTKIVKTVDAPLENLLADPIPADFTLRAFPRKVWVAPFYEVSGQYGVADTLLGNAVMLVAPGDVPLAPTDRPRIVSSSAFDAAWANITVAYWASGGNVVDLEAEVRRFPTTPEKPTIAYLDSPDPARIPVAKPAWVNDKVWFSVQAYRGFGETIANFRQRVEMMLNRVSAWGKPMGLTPGFYDRRSAEGRLTLPEMEECIPLFDEWMQRYSIVTLQPFSRRRPGGTIDYPVMEEWLRREGLANPVRPNRYDWWTPATTPLKDSLTNKLSQSVELISLTKTEKDFLLGKLS